MLGASVLCFVIQTKFERRRSSANIGRNAISTVRKGVLFPLGKILSGAEEQRTNFVYNTVVDLRKKFLSTNGTKTVPPAAYTLACCYVKLVLY